jgi:hypothetical protein
MSGYRKIYLMMKEALRSIYDIAQNDSQAEAAFKNWCYIANQTEVDELKQMAKTIQNNLIWNNRILAYKSPLQCRYGRI